MNNLMMFENNKVEVFELNGKVLFNPKDVCVCLEILNSNDAIKNFNEKQKIKLTNSDIDKTDIRKLNNAGENFLTESGVYKLIMRSNKPSAEKFQDWVTDEVLPQIRKTGGYIPVKQNETDAELMARAFMIAQKTLEQRDALIEEMKPKVEFYDAVTESKDAFDMSAVAKTLNMGIGRNKIFEVLRNEKVLRYNNEPFQKYVDKGWFRTVENKYKNSKGETCITIKTVVFQKGIEGIKNILDKKAR